MADLGALDGEGALSLSTVDGSDSAAAPADGSFAPPGNAMEAIASTSAGLKAKSPSSEVPLDLFAPPDIEQQDVKVELADEELEQRIRKRVSTPPAIASAESTAIGSSAVLQQKSEAGRPTGRMPGSTGAAGATASAAGATAGAAGATVGATGAAVGATGATVGTVGTSVGTTGAMVGAGVAARKMPRWQFAAGIAVAIVLGFVPAHFVAEVREGSAFREIDRRVEAMQASVDSPETYAALDGFRATQLARKQNERRNIALASLGIWAVVGAGLAFVWFRRVPWDRLMRRG
ncbi:MAG: hypothetical protein ACTHU0_03870 [Kofleriaceae bacterium]